MSDSLDTPDSGAACVRAALSLTTPAGLQSIDALTRRRRIVVALNVVTYAGAAVGGWPACCGAGGWTVRRRRPVRLLRRSARRGPCSASGTR